MSAEINAAMEKSITANAAHAHHHKPGKQELDAAHAAMGDRPKIRGPRVVESGREKRRGVVVSVGPEDIFVECESSYQEINKENLIGLDEEEKIY